VAYPPAGVAIFRLAVAANRAFIPHAAAVLQPEELQRAQRYHRPADADRSLLARAAQRLVLGAYLGRPPASLRFEAGANQKPRLHGAALPYNVSHAGDWVLLVVAGAEVGIDVEQLNPHFAFRELLDHSFSHAEKAFIEHSPVPYQRFYQLWTRKEAFVKATGQGIDADFDRVPALPGTHRLAGVGAGPNWVVSSFEAAPGYVAAVAHPAAVAGPLQFYDLGGPALAALYHAALP
jgi:4'-phosphopantetheinyl transferase